MKVHGCIKKFLENEIKWKVYLSVKGKFWNLCMLQHQVVPSQAKAFPSLFVTTCPPYPICAKGRNGWPWDEAEKVNGRSLCGKWGIRRKWADLPKTWWHTGPKCDTPRCPQNTTLVCGRPRVAWLLGQSAVCLVLPGICLSPFGPCVWNALPSDCWAFVSRITSWVISPALSCDFLLSFVALFLILASHVFFSETWGQVHALRTVHGLEAAPPSMVINWMKKEREKKKEKKEKPHKPFSATGVQMLTT